MRTEWLRLRSITAVVVLVVTLMGGSQAFAQTESASPIAGAETADESANLLVYHQITNLKTGIGTVGFPVLSADGTTAVFTDAPGTGAVETPNRIYVIKIDGGTPAEVDSYQTLCYCSSNVDISDDGGSVVSTDNVQLRIADAGGARELVRLASGEITSIRISGDGQAVFFIVRRDTQQSVDGTAMPRGVWAIDANGGDLRHLVGPEEVAAAIGAPVESTGCCFHGDGRPLDVSSDGSHLVFDAYGGGGENAFSLEVGGEPRLIFGPAQYVRRLAISGDGAIVAYDVSLLNISADLNEVHVVDFSGGESRLIATSTASGFLDPLNLSGDGSLLLDTPTGILYSTTNGEGRLLSVLTPGADDETSLLSAGTVRGTLSSDGKRVLYVIRSARCADCLNLPEQLAIIDIGPSDLGLSPVITDAAIDPNSISIDGEATAMISAMITIDGTLHAFGATAFLDGRPDPNVSLSVLKDDGTAGDVSAGDGLYSNGELRHLNNVVRDDDTGPRIVRIQAEIESSDGLFHATAIDFGMLTVEAS